jgi:excinuclease ABC subunit A
MLYAESFSPNTPEGACPHCHGLGRVYDITEQTMVPDPSLTIRERAIAAWPTAWQGQNLRDILTTLGFDIDLPWKDLSKKTVTGFYLRRNNLLFLFLPGFTHKEVKAALRRKEEPSYMGTFTGA